VVFSVVMRWMASWGPFGLQVADLAQKLADAVTLPGDLGVRGLERFFGVERSFPPGRFLPGVVAARHRSRDRAAGVPQGICPGGPGFRHPQIYDVA
jgi:hypothetical protein